MKLGHFVLCLFLMGKDLTFFNVGNDLLEVAPESIHMHHVKVSVNLLEGSILVPKDATRAVGAVLVFMKCSAVLGFVFLVGLLFRLRGGFSFFCRWGIFD